MPRRVYLSLGSNIGDRAANLRAAVHLLIEKVRITERSSVYQTQPVGPQNQPLYFNMALGGWTDLAAADLLDFVKGIETRVGRRPSYRWGPRVIDIDILVMGDEMVQSPDLTIPHEEMMRRAFVLVPLAEIAPNLLPPGADRTIGEMAASAEGRGDVVRVEEHV